MPGDIPERALSSGHASVYAKRPKLLLELIEAVPDRLHHVAEQACVLDARSCGALENA